MVKKEFLIGILLMVVITGIPIAGAENVTPVTTPFITIDPIGNHTIDSPFFINGTTNLAAGNVLQLVIETTNFNPGGAGSGLVANVTVQPGQDSVNVWSCNATTYLWETFGPGCCQVPTPDAVTPGEYVVMVTSAQAYDRELFYMLPAESLPTGAIMSLPVSSPSANSADDQETPFPVSTTIYVPTNPTTRSSPLSVAIPVVVIAAMVIVGSICRRNRRI